MSVTDALTDLRMAAERIQDALKIERPVSERRRIEEAAGHVLRATIELQTVAAARDEMARERARIRQERARRV